MTNNGNEVVVPEKQNSKVQELFNNTLSKNDVDQEIIQSILEEVQDKFGIDVNMNDVATTIYGKILNMLGTPEPINLSDGEKQHKVILIGPTGVGKTTTIAKLAADFLLNKKKSIGLITADTYIGLQQLIS
jgi:flagellar biosynthesis protein FlhF